MLRFALVPLLAAFSFAQQAAPRPAQDILRDYDRVAMPGMSSGADADSVKKFKDAIADGCRRKGELALELWRAHPDHPRAAEVLDIRWAGLTNALGAAAAVAAETGKLLAEESLRDDVRRKASYAHARALILTDGAGNLDRMKAVRALLAADPDDERTGMCLVDLVEDRLGDPEAMRPLLEVAAERWSASPYAGRPAQRMLALLDTLGKPFADVLPEAQRVWFAGAATAGKAFTVVQVWTGWLRTDGEDKEIAALGALQKELGETLSLVGLLDGNLDERLPAARQAGVTWPQGRIEAPERMAAPFRSHRLPLYFVLDAERTIVGVTWNAAAAADRVRTLRAP